MKKPTNVNGPVRDRGRPRTFSTDVVIERAILVFRERGYYATTLTDLTGAMQLSAGSIYKAFTDKPTLFRAALDHYVTTQNQALTNAVTACQTGHDRLIALLTFYTELACGPEGRLGCLITGSVVELDTLEADMAERVTDTLNWLEALILEQLQLGQSDGTIRQQEDPAATARLLLCLVQGMRVVGKTGKSRSDMQAVADRVLRL